MTIIEAGGFTRILGRLKQALGIEREPVRTRQIFISHASEDDGFVRDLRVALEDQGLAVWDDSRELRGGDALTPRITEAIKEARQFIAVLSPHTINSTWVRTEIQRAQAVAKYRKGDGYRVIPLLLPGVQESALQNWFPEEPVAVRVVHKTAGVDEALPQILAALGEELPLGRAETKAVAVRPLAELRLKLTGPTVDTAGGARRAKADATLIYEPSEPTATPIESKRYTFTAPLGLIETDKLRWYLESYYLWPTGVFKERADHIEAQLPRWGLNIYQAALGVPNAQQALRAWQQAAPAAERRFSILVDSDLAEGSATDRDVAAKEAASELLSLPWELLHDGRGFLFHGGHPVSVRRRLPNRFPQPVTPSSLPIRTLLVSPRPEDESAPYIDHRVTALPIVEALESLGKLAELTVLATPTFPNLETALQRAAEAGQPFHVLHFDGHGIYDSKRALGALCFEDPKDAHKLETRASQAIDAGKVGEVLRDRGIALVFLGCCQSAKSEKDPTASVAAKLLEQGVASVAAMSHKVLVETARRFVTRFYWGMARGARVGAAMLEGQRELHGDSHRGKIMGAGELRLEDWFVPVLYQQQDDPQLVAELPSEEVLQRQDKARELSLGKLPEPPRHRFHGRSRELLKLERLLHGEKYALVRGMGGEGKTALVVELARWLVRIRRFRRAAFVSMEGYTNDRGVLDGLGRQLLPEGENWSVAKYPDLKHALQPVARALSDRPTLLVLDNFESVLPAHCPPTVSGGTQDADVLAKIFALCKDLLKAHPATRILFTSREPLPAPFDQEHNAVRLGPLDQPDAVELVGQVMAHAGLSPKADDAGGASREIQDLVEAVGCHARALVLLAPEVARHGVRATTENVRQIMAELHRRCPDDRERSLFASVELSLRRLPGGIRELVTPLAAFHGGAFLGALACAEGMDGEKAKRAALALTDVGLAQEDPKLRYLRLDPALRSYLLTQLSATDSEALTQRWAKVIADQVDVWHQTLFSTGNLSTQLTLLDLPNLLEMLAWIAVHETPERVISLTGDVEDILARLGRPRELEQARRIREQAAGKLPPGWNRGHYNTGSSNVNYLLERSPDAARSAAETLLKGCLEAGDGAYPEAAYDIAFAHFLRGRALKKSGEAEAALLVLEEARRRFEYLAKDGSSDAKRQVDITITEKADCLRHLGQWDRAAEAYAEAIEKAGARADELAIADTTSNLGIVNLNRGNPREALKNFLDSKAIYERAKVRPSIAKLWNLMGNVYRNIGLQENSSEFLDRAEEAYQEAMKIRVQDKDRRGEAGTLSELGELYRQDWRPGRLEHAVTSGRRAVDITVELKDALHEGLLRQRVAYALEDLGRYDEARTELHRAIQCGKAVGAAAQIWWTWACLHDVERKDGNATAAAGARRAAIKAYLEHRRAGGSSAPGIEGLFSEVARAINAHETTAVEQDLHDVIASTGEQARFQTMAVKLLAILHGERDPALASDPDLNFTDAVELQLLLEKLRGH